MSRIRSIAAFAVSTAFVLALGACDENKESVDKSADTGAIAVTTASAVAPSPSAPPAPPVKKVYKCSPGSDVDFHGNAAIETEVRRKLAKDAGAITPADLKTIKSVNLSQATVDDLDPCIFPLFTGAKDVFLGPGDLDDLSPLASLTQLITLRASINKVHDLGPLAKMTHMDRLDVGRTAVHDITPIANMGALTELQLDDTQVTDISPLRSCKNLEKLSIRRTPIKDISPLKDARKLRFLYIEGAPIEDTNVLSSLVGNGLKIVRTGQ